jgi:hypothetical protein
MERHIMVKYIQFTDDEQETVLLVEVNKEEIAPPPGVVKVGLKEKVQDVVAVAQSTFSTAINSAIQQNVQAFMESVRSLPEPPTEVEISFGLKATGEASNIAIGKVGGEVNYTVKLSWKNSAKIT